MDYRLRNWNRRWFMLKDTELRYYKPNKKALKGVINLDTWCKLVMGQSPDSFQLVTPKKTYHLVCKSEQECLEWLQGEWEEAHALGFLHPVSITFMEYARNMQCINFR